LYCRYYSSSESTIHRRSQASTALQQYPSIRQGLVIRVRTIIYRKNILQVAAVGNHDDFLETISLLNVGILRIEELVMVNEFGALEGFVDFVIDFCIS
jgi:hypothetical protein